MGDPVSIAGLVLAAVGTVTSIASASAQAQQQRAIFERNAELERRAATRAAEKAALDEENFRRQASALSARQRASLAAAGSEPSSGTALLLQGETAAEAELNALLIRSQGQDLATALQAQSQVSEFRAASTSANFGGAISGFGSTLLKGKSAFSDLFSGSSGFTGSGLSFNQVTDFTDVGFD